MHVAVARVEDAEEPADLLRLEGEDRVGHVFLPRALAPQAVAPAQLGHRVGARSPTVAQRRRAMSGGGHVEACADRLGGCRHLVDDRRVGPEREARRGLGEVAVRDQGCEQDQLVVGERRRDARRGERPRDRDAVPRAQLSQLAPAVDGEQRMVRGGVEPPAELRRDTKQWLAAAPQRGGHRCAPNLLARVERCDDDLLATLVRVDDLVETPPAAVARVIDECGARKTLAHRRARGEDDEVAGLEAAGDRVEVLEARRRAGDRLALARELLELVELGGEHVVDGRKSLRLSSWATSRIERSAMSTSSRGGASCAWTRAWMS